MCINDQSIYSELVSYYNRNYLYDNSLFLTDEYIFYTNIEDNVLNIRKWKHNLFSISLSSISLNLSIDDISSFYNVVSNDINNIYVNNTLSNIILKNKTLIYINANISTCIFSKDSDFTYIQQYINDIEAGSLKHANISSLNITSNSISIGLHLYSGIGNKKSLLQINLSKLSNLEYIPAYCFLDNYNLSNIIFSNSILTIDKYAFSNCYNLSTLIIPDNVLSINDYAFAYCKNLEHITLGKNTTLIGNNAFIFNNLRSIIIKNNCQIVDLRLNYDMLNFYLKIFVDDNLYDKYQTFISNKYDVNAKYFYYKMSELSNYI